MKRTSLLMKVLIPAWFLFTGIGEFYFVYLRQDGRSQFSMNVTGFIINFLYGVAVGFIYILYESKKADKWIINMPKLLLLFLPMFIVSIFFMIYPFKPQLLTDTMGMRPYLNFTEIYDSVPLALHLSSFCAGFFLISVFSKNNALEKKQNWIKYFCFSITFIMLFFVIRFMCEKILSHAILNQDFSYYTYECLVLLINIVFGVLLWIQNMLSDTVKKRSYFIAGLVFILMGSIPFIFIYISYHTNFTIPYNNSYYAYLRFFRQSDFLQVFQILCGLILIPTIRNGLFKEK